MSSSWRVILVLNLIFIFVGLTPLYPWFSQNFQMALEPASLFLVGTNQKFLKTVNFVLSLPGVYQENGELKRELVLLLAGQAQKEALLKENTLLKSQLKLKPRRSSSSYVLSKVLSRPEADRLTINVGAREGVTENQLVIEGGVLLGKIVEVKDGRAKLLLTISPKSAWEGRTEDFSARGEVVGLFGNKLKLSKVLPTQTLSPRQRVVERGSGLLLGTVESVAQAGTKIFKEADISVPYDPAFLDEVFVVVE